MFTEIEKVREFMRLFGQECPSKPVMPDASLVKNRSGFQKSEAQEMADSSELIGYFDAVLDQLYIAYGHAVAAGFSGLQVQQGFLEVHRSNMTKLWPERYIHNAPPGCVAKEVLPKMYSVLDATGKVVKPPTWTPPDLEPILNQTYE